MDLELKPINILLISYKDIELRVEIDSYRQILSVKAFFDYYDVLMISALELFNKPDMIGQLSIDKAKGKRYLSLRTSILIRKYSIPEIVSVIERILLEAIQIKKLKE